LVCFSFNYEYARSKKQNKHSPVTLIIKIFHSRNSLWLVFETGFTPKHAEHSCKSHTPKWRQMWRSTRH